MDDGSGRAGDWERSGVDRGECTFRMLEKYFQLVGRFCVDFQLVVKCWGIVEYATVVRANPFDMTMGRARRHVSAESKI